MNATFNSYHNGTRALYRMLTAEEIADLRAQIKNGRRPDYVSDRTTIAPPSAYFYTADAVIRYSDHWGNVNTCRWDLVNLETGEFPEFEFGKLRAGICSLSAFAPINA